MLAVSWNGWGFVGASRNAIGVTSVMLLTSCTAGSTAFRSVAMQNQPPDALKTLISPSGVVGSPGAEALSPPATPTCEIRMFIEQLPGKRADGIGSDEVGAVVAEELGQGWLANGVCIKRPGEPLALPATMKIAAHAQGPSLQRFCRDDVTGFKLVVPAATNNKPFDVNGCTWNGIFHSARPFTITLLTPVGHRVGDYVEYLRVYRNGELMAAWNYASAQPSPEKVQIAGETLTTGILAVTHPPHLSDMDIRIIPRIDGVAQTVDTTVRNDRKRFEAALTSSGTKALDSFLPPGSPDRKSFDCLENYVRVSKAKIRQVVNGEIPVLDPACEVLTGTVGEGGVTPLKPSNTPLSEAYARLKSQTREDIDTLANAAYSDIQAAKKAVVADLTAAQSAFVGQFITNAATAALGGTPNATAAVDACKKEFSDGQRTGACAKALLALSAKLSSKYDDLVKLMGVLDGDIQSVLGTADEASALAGDLASKMKGVANDPDKQAQIFNAFAQSMRTAGDTFEARRDNPPLLAGEQKVDMSYSDKFQWFVIAPWLGVPVRLGSHTEADFSAAVALPLVDVVGARYQWAKTRFADARLAVGVGYIETDAGDKKQSAALPNVSIGFGTLKFGVGVATGKGLGSAGDRTRVIIGADLYKIISGSNLEVF